LFFNFPFTIPSENAEEGNNAFKAENYEDALRLYTLALSALKGVGEPQDPLVLLNRCATYLALKRLVKDPNHGY
jgi:hypothetical protein